MQYLAKSYNGIDISSVEWKRPTELCDEPRLVCTNQYGKLKETKQGALNDEWLTAAIDILGILGQNICFNPQGDKDQYT